MRFDLEIPNTNIDLMFIPEGMPIPNGAISTCFIEVDTKNILPSDMISIDENIVKSSFAGYDALRVMGPSFLVSSDKFLITHVAKFMSSVSAKVPLFYKYTISSKVKDNVVKIYDYYGVAYSEDSYLVEQSTIKNGSTYNDITYVYMNKPDRTMFIEYSDQTGISKNLLSLEPIFAEATWEDLTPGQSLSPYKYTIANNEVDTSHNGEMYITYNYLTSMVRLPIANINQPWYISILNTTFSTEVNGKIRNFSIPEYYIQNSNSSSKYKQILNNRCKKIMASFVQLQAEPSKDKLDNITIYINDYYTNTTSRIFTSNPLLQGRNFLGTQLTYEAILDISYDGVIKLPVILGDNDIAIADYYIEEQYYEFRLVDFSTAMMTHGGYFSMFIMPDIGDNSSAVYIAYIGQIDNRTTSEKLWKQGIGFRNMDEYYAFCIEAGAYHLVTIALSSSKQVDILKIHDARRIGGSIGDKKSVCLDSSDMFYSDIINRNILLPANDTLIAVFDASRFIKYGMITLDEHLYTIDKASKTIVGQIYQTIQENLDITSSVIFEFRKDCNIPPSRDISVVNGYISSLIIMSVTEYTGV